MSKGLGTIVSVALNIVLSLWLINNYFYDEPFRNYVNITFGQIYPFLIVSIGVGGGSGLGYVLLKRRHPEQSVASKLQKARLQRQGPPFGSTSTQGRGLSSIASSTQGTRHTAYAVPALPKSTPSSSQRGMPTLSWTSGPKPSATGSQAPQRLENVPSGAPGLSSSPPQALKAEASSSLPQTLRVDQPPLQISRVPPDSSSRPFSVPPWRQDSATPPERKFEPSGPFVKPGLDTSTKPGSTITPGQPPAQAGQQPPAFQPSKWQSPDSTGMKPPQWVDPVPKQGYAPPPKWSPPSGSGPGIPPPQGGMQRPGPFAPPRFPFGQPQPPPRPLTYPGAMRPQEGGGASGPRPFRPDMARPAQGGVPPRPPIQGPRPIPRPGSPPSPSSPSISGDKSQPAPAGAGERSTIPGSANDPQASAAAASKPSTEGAPPGEMDWDTALDTILKTLRKDKLGEK